MFTHRVEITTANFEPVIKHLTSAIKWLDSDQPEDAVMFHLGMTLKTPEIASIQLSVGMIPVGGAARPTLSFAKPYIVDKKSVSGMSQDCFSKDEVQVIRQGITAAGGEIFEIWNGAGLPSVSFNLNRFAGEKVQQLVRNYSRHMRQYQFSWPHAVVALYDLAVKPEYWH